MRFGHCCSSFIVRLNLHCATESVATVAEFEHHRPPQAAVTAKGRRVVDHDVEEEAVHVDLRRRRYEPPQLGNRACLILPVLMEEDQETQRIGAQFSKTENCVVRSYYGHGIGDLFHCAPNIPHYARNKAVGVMKAGQTFTIEPMINAGGHNIIVLAHKLGQYTQLGTTVDDAIGEAFDKTAKGLGLDLRRSGGPAVEELALEGVSKSVMFNVPMKNHKDCNFSYAGLKTLVRLAIAAREIDAKCPVSSATKEDRRNRADIAASFQRVTVLHLEEKCERAIDWAMKLEPSIKHMVFVPSHEKPQDGFDNRAKVYREIPVPFNYKWVKISNRPTR
ncbi:hypothetical protein F2Q69_00010878 [Brassica cretica]|uniref:N(6)-L-threonylcarbamoyladenine synthase n=1 Tax=Brassica cretica TaxID=69181 RepID=A0A8S9R055_BRACR|nr:hypothetical protein F2Q69_00010878 [Brassica cretica]